MEKLRQGRYDVLLVVVALLVLVVGAYLIVVARQWLIAVVVVLAVVGIVVPSGWPVLVLVPLCGSMWSATRLVELLPWHTAVTSPGR